METSGRRVVTGTRQPYTLSAERVGCLPPAALPEAMQRARGARSRPTVQKPLHVLTGYAALPVRITHDEETDEPFLELLLSTTTPPSFFTSHSVQKRH